MIAEQQGQPHIHVSTSSRDCDGPFYTDRMIPATREDWERAIFCGPTLTREDVARHMAERYAAPTLIGSFSRTYDVREPGEGDLSYVVSVSWSDVTEEGFSACEIVACVDPACVESSSQRDVYAEAAGY